MATLNDVLAKVKYESMRIDGIEADVGRISAAQAAAAAKVKQPATNEAAANQAKVDEIDAALTANNERLNVLASKVAEANKPAPEPAPVLTPPAKAAA